MLPDKAAKDSGELRPGYLYATPTDRVSGRPRASTTASVASCGGRPRRANHTVKTTIRAMQPSHRAVMEASPSNAAGRRMATATSGGDRSGAGSVPG